MLKHTVHLEIKGPLATVVLDDPDCRNAMSQYLFDQLEYITRQLAEHPDVQVVLLHGNGPAFCAGFDLETAAALPHMLEQYILRLSALLRAIRRLPQVVVAAAHGAAIAGGCALITACDFVVVESQTKIGYPVHRIGLSPTVSAPTLLATIGSGAARELMMSGRLIIGAEAHRLGLASHVAHGSDVTLETARQLCNVLAAHGSNALRITKQWLNELDQSLDDVRFDGPAIDTGREATLPHNIAMLQDFWAGKGAR